MKKVCWISNAPAPYKVAMMNQFGRKVDLLCLFETVAETDREKTWYNYEFSSFKGIYLNPGDAKETVRKAASECDCLINSDYSKPICMYAVRQFHKHHKKTFLQADGGLAIPRGPIDKIISLVMKQNDWFLSSGAEVDKYFKYYGIPQERILHYRLACMDNSELLNAKKKRALKEEYRFKCGFQEKTVLLSVGQQIPRKGYDVLAEAMCSVKGDVGLYIIGGEPEENVLNIINRNNLANIHFIPFKTKEELSEYYAGADIFVLPTRYDIWGLVINEAMAYGLPIISTDKCIAAVELNNRFHNSVIVPVEDPSALAKAITSLTNDSEALSVYGDRSLSGIQEYSIENMCEDFTNLIETYS